MRALIVYESMYGNTRQIAEAIAEGCRQAGEASVVRAASCDPAMLAGLDLLVIGGPTPRLGHEPSEEPGRGHHQCRPGRTGGRDQAGRVRRPRAGPTAIPATMPGGGLRHSD